MDHDGGMLGDAVRAFLDHAAHGRGLSAETVRAYRGDLEDLLGFCAMRGVGRVADCSLDVLRDWLWAGSERGLARSSIARRSSSVRAFTRWASETGRVATDPGVRLRAPKGAAHLPRVVSEDQVRTLLDGLAARASADDPCALRDLALVELLYAAAIRVSELVGIDVGDLDRGRLTVRVLGKGGKERVVPFGVPARDAVEGWLDRGRPVLLARAAGPSSALFLGDRGARLGVRSAYRVVARLLQGPARRRAEWPAHLPAHRCDAPARRGSRPPCRAGAARARESRDDADLHARVLGAPARGLPHGAPPRLTARRRTPAPDVSAGAPRV